MAFPLEKNGRGKKLTERKKRGETGNRKNIYFSNVWNFIIWVVGRRGEGGMIMVNSFDMVPSHESMQFMNDCTPVTLPALSPLLYIYIYLYLNIDIYICFNSIILCRLFCCYIKQHAMRDFTFFYKKQFHT